jgi:hypothetical protein
LFPCALYLISQPRFLHFTLNHDTPRHHRRNATAPVADSLLARPRSDPVSWSEWGSLGSVWDSTGVPEWRSVQPLVVPASRLPGRSAGETPAPQRGSQTEPCAMDG